MLTKDLLIKSGEKNLEFARKLHDKVKTCNRDSSPNAFADIITLLKIMFNFSDSEIESEGMITDGNCDGSIDCVVFDNKEKRIYIFDVKGGKRGFEDNEIIKFLNDFREYVINENSDSSSLNQRANKKIAEAKEKYHNQNWSISLVISRFFSDQTAGKRIIKQLKDICDNNQNLDYITIDNNKIKQYISDIKDRKDYKWILKIDIKQIITVGNKTLSNLIGKTDLYQIIKLVEDAGENNIFDKNVRINQQDKFIEEKIKNTIKNQQDKFYVYHNGLTISSDKMIKKGSTIEIINPQIINGCQSISAIYSLYKNGKINEQELKDCYIVSKLFSSKEEDFINDICQSTNTQRPVYPWDLRSNDVEQKIIEKILELGGYGYIRKKGKGQKGIAITELGQWIYACENQEPAKAKSGKKHIFDISGMYKKIFNLEKMTFDKLESICNIGIFTKNIIAKEKNKDKKSFYSHADFHILAILYTKYKKINETNFKEAIKVINKAVKKIRKQYGQEYSYNNIFKNPKTWDIIKTL